MNDSYHHMKNAVFYELQDALKVKRVNDELFEFLFSSLKWLVHYTQKNNLPLPDKQRILDMLDRLSQIQEKITS